MSRLVLRVDPALWVLLPARRRRPEVEVAYDGTSSLGHVVESAGVPLTEVGALVVDGERVPASYRPSSGAVVEVADVPRPQPVKRPAFLLDVHLGALARRMRLLGIDTEYDNHAHDADLVLRAARSERVLLTQDRGLLRRRALPAGAYVRGADPDAQLADVLDRFAVPLAPWTRCTVCNGLLEPVAKHEIEDRLEPGTRRTQEEFSRCTACGRIYWPGAHAARLRVVVAAAMRVGG